MKVEECFRAFNRC